MPWDSEIIDGAMSPDTLSLAGEDTVLITSETELERAFLSRPPAPEGLYNEDRTAPPLGSGIWSQVVRGSIEVGGKQKVIALKKCCTFGADKVLLDEAKVLSYIAGKKEKSGSGGGRERYFAEFYGFDPKDSTILLEFIDGMTLARFVGLKRRSPRGLTPMLREPLTGTSLWVKLGLQLCEAFCYLKSINVVHGDIKTHNVILRQGHGDTLVPIVIDFSSARLVVEGFRPEPVSAVTDSFCAPELLEAFLPPKRLLSPPGSPIEPPCPVPTYSSDLYGLAMTVLCAAVGGEVYENAGRHVAIYARQGQPLDWVRRDERVRATGVGSVVDKMLQGCFGRSAAGRIEVETLRDRFAEAVKKVEALEAENI